MTQKTVKNYRPILTWTRCFSRRRGKRTRNGVGGCRTFLFGLHHTGSQIHPMKIHWLRSYLLRELYVAVPRWSDATSVFAK
jgi:hypothetical protein